MNISSMDPEIDARRAIEIAEKFLYEYHNTIMLKSANIENDTWSIIIDVGFLGDDYVEVKVHSNSGKILGYMHVSKVL